MQTVNSTGNLTSASYIIGALQHILRSRVFMPDLDTPYSRVLVPNVDHPTIELSSKNISTILATRQQQLDAVLHQISGLETAMDDIDILYQQLVEQMEKITQSMAFHKGLGSALWRLPTEILSLIFHHCLPEDKYLSPMSNMAPMLLTRICRPWRDVAVNTPSLWCKLHMKIYGVDEHFTGRHWEEQDVEADDRVWQHITFCYDSWLKRSQGCPLSLVLQRYPSTKLLGSLLQPYKHQISSLSIAFPGGAERPQLLLEGLSTLRELVILVMEDSDIPAIAQSISQLPSTMRILDVTNLPFDIHHISSLNPVLAHLTQVKITLYDSDALLQLLRLCPNLSSLRVCTKFLEDRTLEPFTHANIRSFRMGPYSGLMMKPSLLAGVFDALSLPNLRIFEGYFLMSGEWPHKQLRDLFARSKCPLESLIFRGWTTTMDVPKAEYVALIPSLNIVV